MLFRSQKAAAATLISANAQLAKDRAYLAYSVIRSPVSGVVVDREVDVGQTVAASLQTPTLFKIAQDLSKMQIDTNFAEADIGNIRVGQTVRFTVDAFENRHFNGVVSNCALIRPRYRMWSPTTWWSTWTIRKKSCYLA